MNQTLYNEAKITSKYGKRRYKYQGNVVEDFHTGIDLINIKNDEIVAFADGEIVSVNNTGKQGGKACYVRIKHNNGLYTLYYHLKSRSITVKKGELVKKGQVIGIIGNTGIATGIHLHFQIDKGNNKTAIDPTDYIFNGKEFDVELPKINTEFITGKDYETMFDMYVRYGAGTSFAIKKYKKLTEDGKKNALYKEDNKNAVYKKGTRFTVLDIITNNSGGIWAKTPSGYVCLKGASGKVYAKLCN